MTQTPVDAANARRPPRSVPRIVVADADDRTRESLVRLLGIHGRCAVIGSASTAPLARTAVGELAPDCLVLDPRLPNLHDGVALIRALRATDRGLAILALCATPEIETAARDAGAATLRKTFRAPDLEAATVACCVAAARQATG